MNYSVAIVIAMMNLSGSIRNSYWGTNMGSAQSLLEIAINKKDWMYQGNEPNTIAYQYNWILGFCEI